MGSGVVRHEVSDGLAASGLVEAGDMIYVTFCVGNVGQDVEAQVNGALDELERRLALVSLGIEHVVKVDALFRDIWDIPEMEQVFRERFRGAYPARTSLQTDFAHAGGAEGLQFQLDAVAYRGGVSVERPPS